jgi:hypothetical protein
LHSFPMTKGPMQDLHISLGPSVAISMPTWRGIDPDDSIRVGPDPRHHVLYKEVVHVPDQHVKDEDDR